MRMIIKYLGLNNGLAIALVDPFGRPISTEHKQWNIAIVSFCYGRVIVEASRARSAAERYGGLGLLGPTQRNKCSSALVVHD